MCPNLSKVTGVQEFGAKKRRFRDQSGGADEVWCPKEAFSGPKWGGEKQKTFRRDLWKVFFVPRTRLELAHRNRHHPLKVACLPISPSGPLSGANIGTIFAPYKTI